LISDLEAIVSGLQTALPACGAGNEFANIDEVMVAGSVGDCLSDITAVVATVQKVAADIKAKDISSFINDASALITQIKQVIAECKLSEDKVVLQAAEFDFLECIKDALAVAQQIKQFLDDYNNKKDIGALISDLEAIVSGLQTALPACGAGNELANVENVVVENFGDCLSDIAAIVSTVQKVSADIKNMDISSFINDATTLIAQVKQVIAECKVWDKKKIKIIINKI